MADDGFSPEMLDAYFQALARQPDGRAGGGTTTPWTAQDIEANAPAIRQALADRGVTPQTVLNNSDTFREALGKAGIDANLTLDEVLTPHLREQVLMAEGRERARPRYQKAMERAERHGYEALRQRIEGLVEAEAQQHARRGLRREGISATAGERPTPSPVRPVVAPPLPMAGVTNPSVGIDHGTPQFSPVSAHMPLPSRTGAPSREAPSAPNFLAAASGTPPTLAQEASAPRQEPMPQAPMLGGIDYGAPMPGTRPIVETLPRVFPEAERGFYRNAERPTSGIAAMPQTSGEAADLSRQGQDLAFAVGQGLPFAVGGPMARGVDVATRGAGAVGRAVAESPLGQVVAGLANRNPLLTGGVTAGGVTLAARGETADAPPLRERAPGTRQAEADVRARLATAEEDLRTARADVGRYDDRNFAWGNPDAVEAAQRNFQGMDIRVRDPKTGALVPVPSDRRDGPLTRAGAAEYTRRASARVRELETGMTALRDELRRAGDAVREAEGLDAREASSRRMQELDEPTLVQRFGPNAGYAVGFGKGIFDRWLLGRAYRGLAQTRTDRANALMADMGKGDVNERIGRLNQLWTEGGSRNPPYPYTPGARPYPWSAAPDAPPGMSSVFTPRDPSATLNASRLYRPGAVENYGPVAGTMGFGGYEMYLGESMIHEAERELNAAMSAVSGKNAPTEVEMQRVRDARQQLAWAVFTRNLGRGEIAGGAMTDLHARAHAPARPNMGRAEAERADVDLLLNPPAAHAIPPPGGPNLLLPHSSTYQPRAGGRFAPGRPVYPPGDPRRGGS